MFQPLVIDMERIVIVYIYTSFTTMYVCLCYNVCVPVLQCMCACATMYVCLCYNVCVPVLQCMCACATMYVCLCYNVISTTNTQ